MKSILAAATAALAFAASTPAAAATLVLFSNFDGISTPLLSSQGYDNVATADGWTGGQFGIEIQNGVAGNAYSAFNLVELDTTTNSSMFVNLVAGHYTVSYYYSPRINQGAATNGIDLSIGATQLDSVTGNGGGSTVWQLRTVDFVTTGGALTFAATGNADGVGGYLDSITISEVPEPATWGLMIAGFAMTGFAARRRGQRNVAG